MASLRRFPRSPYWYACFTRPDGKQVQVSTKETDKRRAQKIADRFDAAAKTARMGLLVERQARKVIADIYEISNRHTLASDSIAVFFNRWLSQIKVEARPKTHRRYTGIVQQFLHWLGPRAQIGISHLSSVEVTGFRDYLRREHSPATANLYVSVLQAGLSKAFSEGLVDVNEAARVSRLKTTKNQTRRVFTDTELRAILRVADPEWKGMILTGLYTGLRLGDVASLAWNNVNLETRELSTRTQKTGRQQVLPLAQPLHSYLVTVASADRKGPIFPRAYELRQRDIPNGMLSSQFYRLMETAGIVDRRTHKKSDQPRAAVGLGFHALRHTATTLLKQSGASDVVAREIIGHQSAAVSRTYSHIDTATLRLAIDRLPDLTD